MLDQELEGGAVVDAAEDPRAAGGHRSAPLPAVALFAISPHHQIGKFPNTLPDHHPWAQETSLIWFLTTSGRQ